MRGRSMEGFLKYHRWCMSQRIIKFALIVVAVAIIWVSLYFGSRVLRVVGLYLPEIDSIADYIHAVYMMAMCVATVGILIRFFWGFRTAKKVDWVAAICLVLFGPYGFWLNVGVLLGVAILSRIAISLFIFLWILLSSLFDRSSLIG